MISLVLYGRNDSYGYNLHKRAAISLNCIAEVLTHEQDEILFVDYNTPDDFPTFPEAIQDTLTPRVRGMLRILRVRPSQHDRFRERTHLVAPEPIARNIAVRRSNPRNRWILSTNTDMIFVPRAKRSLSEIAGDLSDGYYHLPRFEIPESLWESLDRTTPAATIEKIEAWGRRFHLNEIIYANDPAIKYDAPGDFQLMLRADLFKIGAFHEGMLLGWHVDSNIAKRLSLLHKQPGDLTGELFGYHCDHTRQITPMHRPGSVQNDLATFVDKVASPFLPEQQENWGMAGEAIEEWTVDGTSKGYIRGLEATIANEMLVPTSFAYASHTYGQVDYTPEHLLPFLLDIFASYPRTTHLGWFGSRPDLLLAFVAAWHSMGFSEPILVADQGTWLGPNLPEHSAWSSEAEIQRRCSVFVFDWGLPVASEGAAQSAQTADVMQFVSRSFNHMVWREQQRQRVGEHQPRRFVGINAIHNRYEGHVGSFIGAARTPMTSRIRQGFPLPKPPAIRDLLPRLSTGPGGERRDGGIALTSAAGGHAVYGPYLSLEPGQYELKLSFKATPAAPPRTAAACAILLELYAAPFTLLLRPLRAADLHSGTMTYRFTITEELLDIAPWSALELRLAVDHDVQATLIAATLERLETEAADSETASDWLPLMRRGGTMSRVYRVLPRLARRFGWSAFAPASRFLADIHIQRGESGHVLYGPYLAIPPARYRASFTLQFARPYPSRSRVSPIALEITMDTGRTVLAHERPMPAPGGTIDCALVFEVPAQPDRPAEVEVRIWSDGTASFQVRSILVAPLAAISAGAGAV